MIWVLCKYIYLTKFSFNKYGHKSFLFFSYKYCAFSEQCRINCRLRGPLPLTISNIGLSLRVSHQIGFYNAILGFQVILAPTTTLWNKVTLYKPRITFKNILMKEKKHLRCNNMRIVHGFVYCIIFLNIRETSFSF